MNPWLSLHQLRMIVNKMGMHFAAQKSQKVVLCSCGQFGNHFPKVVALFHICELCDIIDAKMGYLNPVFFTIRTLVYFAVWIIPARVYFTMSRKQARLRKRSPRAPSSFCSLEEL